MKKLSLIMAILFYSGVYGLFSSQSKADVELPVITDIGKELKGVPGWSQDNMRRWMSAENRIPTDLLEFEKIRLSNISYENNEYTLFGIYETDHGDEYPSIFAGCQRPPAKPAA
ncbi:MAG: hypothetical protein LBG43_04355 [Treponema sp.]|jgi:hypothetical protein|nr:hypothetical protein [Treponema sp.]